MDIVFWMEGFIHSFFSGTFYFGNWACRFNFLFTALIGKLLPLPHTNACQTLGSFCSLKKFELCCLPALPERCGLAFQGAVTLYIAYSSRASSRFPCDCLLWEWASSWQHLVLSTRGSAGRKLAGKYLPRVLNMETVTELKSKLCSDNE